MLTKEKIMETVDRLPNDFTIKDLFDRLSVINKIEEGNTYTTEKVKQSLSKGLK